MRLIRGFSHLEPFQSGCVLTIGNFDGLHLGHQRVISTLANHGRRLNLPVVAMVFEPQPLEYFLAEHAPSRLSRLREKVIQFTKLPIDILFNRVMADYSAEDFISEILVKRLKVRHLVIGDDFHFGMARRGNFSLLQTKGLEYGYTVESSTSFELEGCRISSTLIRDALLAGRLDQAKFMLGRDYSVCGRVAHGDKRGRELGFPTANVPLFRKNAPISGVFAVTMTGLDGCEYQGVANVGIRPTFAGSDKAVLETHLFNFDADIYGCYIEVHFKQKIRNEMKFKSLEDLKNQILTDIDVCKLIFSQMSSQND